MLDVLGLWIGKRVVVEATIVDSAQWAEGFTIDVVRVPQTNPSTRRITAEWVPDSSSAAS